ncbi:MAG: QueT transporter family protein [candidate division WOR-3 bacterium]|nr:QueT transporter family protein [candidate division WOR-3 bacterium]
MKEIFTMWRNTRMIILTAFSAAIYAAILIPFKVVVPLIPGFTEFRPANAIPIVCSVFFGPAGAWGSAIGNFIGDALGGTFGLGSIFGFFGNFLYGLIPYKILYPVKTSDTGARVSPIPENFLVILLSIFSASIVCAVVIAWGVDMLGLVPFAALGSIIFLNNFVVAGILSPILIRSLQKRLLSWNLVYTSIMEEKDLPVFRSPFMKRLGIILLIIGGVSGLIIGLSISLGIYKSALFAMGFSQGMKGGTTLALGLIPSLILIILSLFLL